MQSSKMLLILKNLILTSTMSPSWMPQVGKSEPTQNSNSKPHKDFVSTVFGVYRGDEKTHEQFQQLAEFISRVKDLHPWVLQGTVKNSCPRLAVSNVKEV